MNVHDDVVDTGFEDIRRSTECVAVIQNSGVSLNSIMIMVG